MRRIAAKTQGLSLLLILLLAPVAAADDATVGSKVSYLHDIRPILVSRCFKCHSSAKQEGNLRLDSRDGLLQGGDNGPVLVSGKSGDSRLLQAVRQSGDLKMPPEGSPLSAEQIELLRRWIDEGATIPTNDEIKHWSFVPPVRPTLPHNGTNPNATLSPITAIDTFVKALHAEKKLVASPPASKAVLLRRLYLDLIGLPPTAEELQAYLADEAPDAYDRVVERLLASPAHGERWGRHWMDVWRYSDWDGYGTEIRESQPHIWRWRDWIVESLNADKPYSQMIVEMLAGDEAAPEDPATLRATGFLVRNWYKFNRHAWLDNTVEHTGKAFLGLTFNCARCHDHMYDPFQQNEYYSLRSIFEPYDIRTDRLPGEADTTKDGVVRVFDAKLDTQTVVFIRGDDKQPDKDRVMTPAAPKMLPFASFKVEPVTLSPQAFYPGSRSFIHNEALSAAKADAEKAQANVEPMRQALAAAKRKLDEFNATQAAAKPAVAGDSPGEKKPEPEPTEPKSEIVLDDDFATAKPDVWTVGAGKWEHQGGHLRQLESLASSCSLTAIKPHPRDFVATFRLQITGGNQWRSVGLSFDGRGDERSSVYISAYAGGPKVQISYRQNNQDHYPADGAKALPIETNKVYELQVAVRGQLLNVSLNGESQLVYRLPITRASAGQFSVWCFDATGEFQHLTLKTLDKATVLSGQLPSDTSPPPSPVSPALADFQKAETANVLAEKTLLATQRAVATVEARIAADRANFATPVAHNAQELSLAAGKLERELAVLQAEQSVAAAEQKLVLAKHGLNAADEKTKKALADAEAGQVAATKARDAVQASLMKPNDSYTRFSAVHPTTSTGRRLALARWIATKENPLTARVAANHIWLRHFGTPLVHSVFDFGNHGTPPTNPPLLDWLATNLTDQAWQMKSLHREIVASATYRQAAQHPDPQVHAVNTKADPENKFFWHSAPRRMEAELVRDATLHVSGELRHEMYGVDLDPNAGLTLTRRSLYFRSSKEKKMTFLSLFDSPNTVECYRRSESIAPQQALAMANSGLTLVQSRLLAKKLSAQIATLEEGQKNGAFVAAAFEQILTRPASPAEQQECELFLREQAARFANQQSLTRFPGKAESPVKPADDAHQRARENLVHVLFNHHDFVTVR